MFFSACSADDSPWDKMIKITMIIIFALIRLLVFARGSLRNRKNKQPRKGKQE